MLEFPKIFTLCLSIFVYQFISAQENLILFQYETKIGILNPINNEEKTLFITNENLYGYSIEADSLVIYTSSLNSGIVNKRTFNISSDFTLVSKKKSSVYPNINYDVYKFEDYEISFLPGIKVGKNNQVLWEIENKPKWRMGLVVYKTLFSDFDISFSQNLITFSTKTGFFKSRYNVVTADLNTGKKKLIAKKSESSSFSCDGKYLLYKEHNQNVYHIYNLVSDEKNRKFYKTCYWLCK